MRRAYSPKPTVSGTDNSLSSLSQAISQRTYADNHGSGEGAATDKTLTDFAKTGAVLCGLLFAGFALVQTQAWSWLQIGAGAALAAVAGAVAGAVLYIALKLLAIAVKVMLILLGVGIVLHFLGVLNLFHVLGAMGRLVQ